MLSPLTGCCCAVVVMGEAELLACCVSCCANCCAVDNTALTAAFTCSADGRGTPGGSADETSAVASWDSGSDDKSGSACDAAVAPAVDSDETVETDDCNAPITFDTFDAMSAPDGSTDDSGPGVGEGGAEVAEEEDRYGEANGGDEMVEERLIAAAIDWTAPMAFAALTAMSAPDGSMKGKEEAGEDGYGDGLGCSLVVGGRGTLVSDCIVPSTLLTPSTISIPDGSTDDSGEGAVKAEEADVADGGGVEGCEEVERGGVKVVAIFWAVLSAASA